MSLGTMSHLALTVSDLKAAESAFYAPVLRFLGYDKVEDTPEMTLWFSRTTGGAINLWQAKPELVHLKHRRYAPGFHHFAFAASRREDVDRLHRLLAEIGAEVLDGPAEYEYVPGYYAVFFADPDGLKFELAHVPAIPD